MTNLKNMKTDDLRSELMDRFSVSEQEVAKMTKSQLVEMLEQKNMEHQVSALFNDNEHEDLEVVVPNGPTCLQDTLPKFATQEWQTYVLGLLGPDEQVNGFPKSVGLRRVSQLVLGPIINEGPTSVTVLPDESGGRSVTVTYEVVYSWHLDRPITINPFANNLELIEETRCFRGVADCLSDNTNFGKHPAATAETKAASRAYKKALSLNVLTAEEKIAGDDDGIERPSSTARVNPALSKMIEARVKHLNLDFNAMISEFGCGSLDKMTQETAAKFFDFVNGHSNKRAT